MERFALLVILRAKPGKDREVEVFFVAARPIVLVEVGTASWYAVKFDSEQYGIFDTFADEGGRNAHLNGQVAEHANTKIGHRIGCGDSVQESRECQAKGECNSPAGNAHKQASPFGTNLANPDPATRA